MLDWLGQAIKSLYTTRRYPALAIVILALASISFNVYMQFYSGNKHFRNAQRFYEEGDFTEAIKEVEIYLDEEPDAIAGLDILADSHAALATMYRGKSAEEYMERVCAAIETYKKRLDIRFNNNVSTKKYLLEERTGNMVDSSGRFYGGCSTTEVDGEETEP